MDTLAALALRVERVAREMDGAAQAARLRRVGKDTVPDIAKAVRADLGDLSMSGWRRGNPIDIVGDSVVSDGLLEMRPARMSKGPMRVLQDGRQSYAAGDRRNSGTYTSKRTGEVKQRTRKVKRNVGGHGSDKNTWTDATQIMQREMPKRYEAELVKDLGKHLRRG